MMSSSGRAIRKAMLDRRRANRCRLDTFGLRATLGAGTASVPSAGIGRLPRRLWRTGMRPRPPAVNGPSAAREVAQFALGPGERLVHRFAALGDAGDHLGVDRLVVGLHRDLGRRRGEGDAELALLVRLVRIVELEA